MLFGFQAVPLNDHLTLDAPSAGIEIGFGGGVLVGTPVGVGESVGVATRNGVALGDGVGTSGKGVAVGATVELG